MRITGTIAATITLGVMGFAGLMGGCLPAQTIESYKKIEHNPFEKAIVGEQYEAQTPDTLDLADRMSLAVNALTSVWNPEERWGLYFGVDFSRRPPVLCFNHVTDAYLNIPPKFLESLVLCRLASAPVAKPDQATGETAGRVVCKGRKPPFAMTR